MSSRFIREKPKPVPSCWKCRKPLNGPRPFFCNAKCAEEWAMQEAFVLDRRMEKYRK
jgi:hypothetical protein